MTALPLMLLLAAGGLRSGMALPSPTFVDFRGSRWEAADPKPRAYVMLAYWCDTWKVMRTAISQAQKDVRADGIEWVVVSVDGRWTELADQWTGVVKLKDPGSAWCKENRVREVPTTILVDRGGTIRSVMIGTHTSQGLLDEIGKALPR